MTLDEGVTILEQRALIAKASIIGVVASSALLAAAILTEIVGWAAWDFPLSDNLYASELIAYISLVILFISFFAVGFWIHRAHANLVIADRGGLEYTPGWAIGWFAVPIANLFKPFQAMRELWNASEGALDRYDDAATGLLWVWWFGWLLSNVSSSDEIWNTLDLVGVAATIISAAALWMIIETITELQHSLDFSATFE